MPQCISLTLQPRIFVLAAIVIIVFTAISRVINTADTDEAGVRMLDLAAIVIMSIVGASILISHVWFWMIPLDD